MAWEVCEARPAALAASEEALPVVVEWACETWTHLPCRCAPITRPFLALAPIPSHTIRAVTRDTGEELVAHSGAVEDSAGAVAEAVKVETTMAVVVVVATTVAM